MISKIIFSMIEYFGTDIKRINHALKVYGFAKIIGELEGVTKSEQTAIELTAVLHDIGIKESERKFGSAAGPHQETEGPPIARKIMHDTGIEEAIIERVCFIISRHHSYNEIDGVDFRILVEADFLVNINEENLNASIIERIKQKHFQTSTGIKLLETIYS